MIRISVTTLEQFRRFCEYEYVALDNLVASVQRKPVEPTWQMRCGSAWDQILADTVRWPMATEPKRLISDDFECLPITLDGFAFTPQSVWEARREVGPGIWQCRSSKVFETSLGACEVVGKADHLYGLVCTDVKAKFSNADPSDHDADLQWRLYCLIFGSTSFRYILCKFKEPKDGGVFELTELLPFNQWPYPRMEQDCLEWIERFFEWAAYRDLLRFLEPKQ